MNDWVQCVASGNSMTEDLCVAAIAWLLDESADIDDRAEFLKSLALKGESANELAVFARELRARSLTLPLPDDFSSGREVLDVCGTGGDQLNTFNISTTVALLCSAAGVIVAKHGNRAVTSASGSADVLEALGVPIRLSPVHATQALERDGFAFLFAPDFHPAFKAVGPVRRLCASRGQRTIFNFLGPLLNPAQPTVQLLGVSRPELTSPMAQTLQRLGLRRAMVVAGGVPLEGGGTAYLDELSTLGENAVAEFHQGNALCQSSWSPEDFPLSAATLQDLSGGNAQQNARIVHDILSGMIVGPRLEAVLLNAGAALFLAGRARSMLEGWNLAMETIRSGVALKKLESLQRG